MEKWEVEEEELELEETRVDVPPGEERSERERRKDKNNKS
jgi:hypothetical protein